MGSTVQLPVIDLKCPPEDRLAKGKIIVDNLENVGFFLVENVDMNFDKLYAACKWFFNKPQEYKDKVMRKFWNPDNNNVYRGYYPIVPGEASRKEAFEFGLNPAADDPDNKPGNWMLETSTWPEEDGTFPFKEFLLECYDIFMTASKEILDMVALALELPGAFESVTAGTTLSTLRIIRYEPWHGEPPKSAYTADEKVVTTPEHFDTSFLTLLATFGSPGLEVEASDGSWIPIEVPKKMLVFNIGNGFESVMSYRFKATKHRVLDINRERFSVPFFLDPSYSLDIGDNFMSKVRGLGEPHEKKRFGPWALHLMKYVKNFAEYRALPDIE